MCIFSDFKTALDNQMLQMSTLKAGKGTQGLGSLKWVCLSSLLFVPGLESFI